jgi:hypothetical protein
LLADRPAPELFLTQCFSHCIPPVECSTFVLWNGKILRKRRVLFL